jgi:eukaryotic-like serine/threonine-protein kinase
MGGMTRDVAGPPVVGDDLRDDPRIGTVIADRYRLIEKLGEGGAGSVYKGVHEALRKPVAIKLLGRAARHDPESVARFQREAVAAANLKHPAIAEATDSGQLPDGTLFLVMEHVDGRSLRRVLVEDGRLPPARALGLIRQIGAAVAFAHQSYVVHRDLKPENVIVFDRGEERDLVKVIDFGIARMRSSFGGGPSGLTQLGTVVGTLEYMSPEQAMGQPVDARADQYAIGIIAFEMLTGEPPYAAEDAASLVYQHVGAPIPAATERAPELPPSVDAVLTKMLGKLPDERFDTLQEAIAALASALEGQPVVAPASVAEPPVSVARTAVSPAPPPASVAQVHGITAKGTIISADRPPAVPLPAATAEAAGQRSQRELPIILITAIVSVIGLAIVLAILFARSRPANDETSETSPSADESDEPAMLAPTSHDPGHKPPRKAKGRKKGRRH